MNCTNTMQILVKTEVCDGEILWRCPDNTDVNRKEVNLFKIPSVYRCWYSLEDLCWSFGVGVVFFSFCAANSFIFSLVSCGGASKENRRKPYETLKGVKQLNAYQFF